MSTIVQRPYLVEKEVVTHYKYNPNYGDDRICQCGHPYYRHFDSYENMENIGCKYCCCSEFIEETRVENNTIPKWATLIIKNKTTGTKQFAVESKDSDQYWNGGYEIDEGYFTTMFFKNQYEIFKVLGE